MTAKAREPAANPGQRKLRARRAKIISASVKAVRDKISVVSTRLADIDHL